MRKDKKENLFKGKFDKKVRIDGVTNWFHDPSGEEMIIVPENDEKNEDKK